MEISDVAYGIAESGKLVDDVGVVDVDHSRLVAVQVKVEGFFRRPHHGSFVTYYLKKVVKYSFKSQNSLKCPCFCAQWIFDFIAQVFAKQNCQIKNFKKRSKWWTLEPEHRSYPGHRNESKLGSRRTRLLRRSRTTSPDRKIRPEIWNLPRYLKIIFVIFFINL